ncbi:MAG TPA: HPP family protein [Archangium sp.]|nr:HPP family protein [Archangium sp.]
MKTLQDFLALMGLELTPNGHFEKLLSGIGGFIGIMAVLVVSTRALGDALAVLIVASMGASAVLLFAVPHGPLSQPWPVAGGHILSALVGVTCFRLVRDPRLAAPTAVGLSIVIMYYGRCIHPPEGATALTAVIGGEAVHSLGYWYVVTPVALNALIILAVAVAVNWPFAWRRYPGSLVRRPRASEPRPPAISHEHLSFAVRQMGSLIDVSEDDLVEIYSLAQQHAQGTHVAPEQIRVGGCYANSPSSPHYAVRLVVEEKQGTRPEERLVVYEVVAGREVRRYGTTTRAAFALWATAEVPAPPEQLRTRAA